MRIRPSSPVIVRPVVIALAPSTLAGFQQPTGERIWTGEGPPPPAPPTGVQVGDSYLDSLSGNLYRLDPGE